MIRMENVGQLKEGYEANFVVLTDDLMTLSHNQLMHVKPFATYIEGECVLHNPLFKLNKLVMKMLSLLRHISYISPFLKYKEGVSLGGTIFNDHLHCWKLIVLFLSLFTVS